jgi:hypothetical protein
MKSFEKETIRKQLKDESQCLKDLEKAYEKARKDCQEQLRRLNSRKDMQNLQSIIYQKKYQTALLKQIDGVLNDLQTHTYKTANEFFQGSYQNGYIGSMYELQKQGIPFTIPIDPKKMVAAIQTDSKISKDYYLGKGLTVQNIRTLKKQIALDCTRGIASGLGWLEVAESLAVQKRFQIDLSDAMRIARTEGNRINQQARLDAGDEAVQNGCDIVKQWDATLDGKTRPAHQEADGQIREWGEDFDVMGEKLPAPSVGGSASNVCNCRCQLLKRPRWALDDEELQVLKDRASYYGLDKTKNFEEYKEKFLKLPSNAQTATIYSTLKSGEDAKNFFGNRPDRSLRKSNRELYDQKREEYNHSMFGKWRDGLTMEQERAINNYSGDDYSGINGYLRHEMTKKQVESWDALSNMSLSEMIRNIDDALDEFELDAPIKVFRTCENDVLRNLKLEVGAKFRDDGFVSTSVLNEKVASGNIVMEINVPKGKGHGAWINPLSGAEDEEWEYLLPRGSEFKVKSITKRGEDTVVEMDWVGHEKQEYSYASKAEVLSIWKQKGLDDDVINNNIDKI